MAESRICSVDGCHKKTIARGWCQTHYDRWRNHGDPLKGKPSKARRGAGLLFINEVALAYNGDDCLIWPFGKFSNKYGQVFVGGKTRGVHNVICWEAYGEPPTKEHQAAHSCRNKACCNPAHLRWATPQENQGDRVPDGTDPKGERNGSAKLSEDDVREIRALLQSRSRAEIAQQFCVSHALIWSIDTGRTWAWLT